jgi:hypothetical protein
VASVAMVSRVMFAVILLLSSLLKKSFVIAVPISLFKTLFGNDNDNWWITFTLHIFFLSDSIAICLNPVFLAFNSYSEHQSSAQIAAPT